MSSRGLVYVLAALLARTAAAQVPLQSDAPRTDATTAAPEAPVPPVVSPSAPSGTTLPQPKPAPRPVHKPLIDSTRSALAQPLYVRHRPNVGVLTGGLSLLVAGYVADVAFTYGYDHHPASTSLIPIAGPWLQLSQRYGLDGPPVDTGSADADARARQTVDNANHTIRGLAFSGEIVCGVLQATGVVMAITGAILKGQPRRMASATHSATLARIQPNGSLVLHF